MFKRIKGKKLAWAAAALGILLLATTAFAGKTGHLALGIESNNGDHGIIEIPMGKSEFLDLKVPVKRISLSNPEIATVNLLSPTNLLINAKKMGATNLILWPKKGDLMILDILVSSDVQGLAERIRQTVEGTSAIKVTSTGEQVILSGSVDSLVTADQAVKIARAFAANVVNLIQVEGIQQVQVEVKFAEVSRSALREIGMSGFYQGEDFTIGMFNPQTSAVGFANVPDAPVPVPYMPYMESFNFFASHAIDNWSGMLSLLEEEGFSKTLAEPKLISMSGQKASFLAGGEFPIPISEGTGGGSITIEFKEFGIRLNFTPTVLTTDTISLVVAPEVSEIDFTLGVTIGSVQVPGLSTRRAQTSIQLKNGQSFAIAGLLSERTRSIMDKVPGLGDLPILGALFRSTKFKREETELLIVVTPRLIRPMAPHEVPLAPGEEAVYDPNDLELFLLGSIKHHEPSEPTPAEGGDDQDAGSESDGEQSGKEMGDGAGIPLEDSAGSENNAPDPGRD